eukprot:2269706-Rhodomonas_salina.1
MPMRSREAHARGGGVKLVDHPLYEAPQLRTSYRSIIPRLCCLCLILLVVCAGSGVSLPLGLRVSVLAARSGFLLNAMGACGRSLTNTRAPQYLMYTQLAAGYVSIKPGTTQYQGGGQYKDGLRVSSRHQSDDGGSLLKDSRQGKKRRSRDRTETGKYSRPAGR